MMVSMLHESSFPIRAVTAAKKKTVRFVHFNLEEIHFVEFSHLHQSMTLHCGVPQVAYVWPWWEGVKK